MSLLSIIRVVVLRIQGGDAHDSYGGNSTASDSTKSEDSVDEQPDERIGFHELAHRAEQYESGMQLQQPDDQDRRDGPAFDPEDYPDAIARNGRVVLTGGEIHDWIQADADHVINIGGEQ